MLSNLGSIYRNLATLCLIIQFVLSFAGSVVKYLPGFDGELPFTLETGYISVGSAEMFYYFIESEGNPKRDPLLLWYSGGPGCSAFNGLIYQIGPIEFNISDYDGGLPPLSYYPYSWTKSASILFVDAPVGTGFSYSTTQDGWPMSDTKTGLQVYDFLNKWLIDHPQYLLNKLFVGADSYAGISAPMVVQHILDGNVGRQQPQLNLKGYIVGCPKTDSEIQENSVVIYAHRMALISDELYMAAKNSCNSNFYVVDTNSQCYVDLQLIKKCIQDIGMYHILEPKCTWASPHRPTEQTARRSLRGNPAEIMSSDPVPEKWCRNFNYSLSYIWANDEAVQAALNVRPGTVQDWVRCNQSLNYDYDVTSVVDYHRNFTKRGLQTLVYNGDHDPLIPNVGTQQWIRELNLTIDVDWRQWLVDGQVAGYTMQYSRNGYQLTYATVKGAGHSPQEYKRRECFDMFDRFIHYYPL